MSDLLTKRSTAIVSVLLLLSLAAAACSSDDGDASNSTVTPANSEPEATATSAPTGSEPESVGPTEISATIADGWSATVIGQGIKPTLALDSTGSPAIAYLFEAISGGFVSFAAAKEDWTPEQFAEGYFYGPLDLTFDLQDRPNIVYHDHQASNFRPELGDLVYALRNGEWQITALEDDGHDGWDSAIAIGGDGIVPAAGIDPSQFNSTDGVEYYESVNGQWTVTAIGSGPIQYEFNVSLAVSPENLPALTYYDNINGDLMLASFDGSAWSIEAVATEGTVGKFSSLAFDADGRPHIVFFEEGNGNGGRVMYAVRDENGWTLEAVGELTDVRQGMTGARRITSVALDAQGVPHVAFSDVGVISYATRTESGWKVEEIVSAGDRVLGQLVSLKVGANGTAHIAFYEVTQASPLDGLVVYLSRPAG